MLINKIVEDALEARKAHNKDTASLLTTLYSEALMVGKNKGNRQPTDEEVYAVVEKFVKNAKEVEKYLLETGKGASKVAFEIETLSKYLPEKMSEEELTKVIKEIIEAFKIANCPVQMGKIMGSLKENFNGMYDGKMASEIVKRILTNKE